MSDDVNDTSLAFEGLMVDFATIISRYYQRHRQVSEKMLENLIEYHGQLCQL